MKRNDVYLALNAAKQRVGLLYTMTLDELETKANKLAPSRHSVFANSQEAVLWHVERILEQTAESIDPTMSIR